MECNYIKQHPWNIFQKNISSRTKTLENLKYPPVLSKFKPSSIDPHIPVHDAAPERPDKEKMYNYGPTRSSMDVSKEKPPIIPKKKTSIQTALQILGIDNRIIVPSQSSNPPIFWNRSPSYLWNMLELAKRRYELEILHAHPDMGGDPLRASQLNSAWRLIQRIFEKHGYNLQK